MRSKIVIRSDENGRWKIQLKETFIGEGIYDHTLYFNSVTEAVGWCMARAPKSDIVYMDGSYEAYAREGMAISL